MIRQRSYRLLKKKEQQAKQPSIMSLMSSHVLVLLSLPLFLLGTAAATGITDMLDPGCNITDGETLISANGSFTLGFFSPGVTTRRYDGIWFSVSETTVCWVANRERPLNDTSGLLVLSDTGSLVILDGSGQVIWSSNSASATWAVAQLLESGNLVVYDDLLPGMKTGKNLWTGAGPVLKI